jgi:hypothetical protein
MPKPIDVNRFDQDFIYDLDLPMPSWRWMAKFSGPDMPGVDWNALLVERVSAPNGEVLEIASSFGAGRTLYYPSFPNTGQVSISFYETEEGAANLSLVNWGNVVKSPQGFYGLPVDYKCKLLINLFGYSSNSHPVYAYSFEGVWPADTGQLDLSYDEDNRIIVTTSFACDAILSGARVGRR